MARSDRDWKPRSHGTQDTANPHAYRALQRIYFKYWEPLRRRLVEALRRSGLGIWCECQDYRHSS